MQSAIHQAGFDSFLRVAFSTRPPQTKQATLHQIIVSGEIEQIKVKLKFLRNSNSTSALSAPVSDRKVTPLHLCAMRDKLEAATLLLAEGASLKATDSLGCTPLHIAAMNGNSILLKVFIKHADQQDLTIRGLRNAFFATAEEIESSFSIPNYPKDACVGYLQADSEKPLTSSEFKTLTGAEFCPYLVVEKGVHIRNWLHNLMPPFGSALHTKLNEFNSNSSRIALAQGASGLSVRTRGQIPKYEIVDLVGGLLKNEQIDTSKHTTLISYAEDGPPTSVAFPVYVHGVEQTAYIALCDHPLGMRVQINHGVLDPVKWGNYLVNPSASLTDFVERGEFLNNLKPLSSEHSTLEGYLNHLFCLSILDYIFDTPAVLAYMLLYGKLSPENCNAVLTFFSKHRSQWTVAKSLQVKTVQDFAVNLILIVQALKDFPDSALAQQIKKELWELMQTQKMIWVVQEIAPLAKDIPTQAQNWQTTLVNMHHSCAVKNGILTSSKETLPPNSAEVLQTAHLFGLKKS